MLDFCVCFSVRPKLNVKPSVMKPAAQVKPGQKRKSAGTLCSAVAAVKPLNAAPAPDVEPPCKRTQVNPTGLYHSGVQNVCLIKLADDHQLN